MVNCTICNQSSMIPYTKDYAYCGDCNVAVRVHNGHAYDYVFDRTTHLQWGSSIRYDYAIKQIGKMNKVRDILDFGCGDGLFGEMLWKAGYTAYGMDLNDNVKSEYHIRPYVNIPYDLITCLETLEHVSHPLETLRSFYDMLRFGGYVYITTPNLLSYDERSLWSRHGEQQIFTSEHVTLFEPNSLRDVVARAGFRVLSIETKTQGDVVIAGTIQTLKRGSYPRILKVLYNLWADSWPAHMVYNLINPVTERDNKGKRIILIGRKD